MNPLAMETFLVVVQSQSLTKAAKELHIAQTTVSQRLKVLEKELGLKLIERGKGIKQISLTPSGEEFYKLAEQWRFIQESTKTLQAQGPKLGLVVGSVDSINTFVLPPVYESLINYGTPFDLSIQTLHSAEIYEKIESRQIDVGFVVRDRVHPNVIVKKVFTNPMVGLCLKRNPKAKSQKVHPSELNPDHELYMPWGHEFQNWHDHWWGGLPSTAIKLDSTHLFMKLLKNSDQWAVVPQWIANQALTTGNFSVFQLTDPPPDFVCYKLIHRRNTALKQQALSVFDQFLQSSISSRIDDQIKISF